MSIIFLASWLSRQRSLMGLLYGPHSAEAAPIIRVILYDEVELFWLHVPLSNSHRNERADFTVFLSRFGKFLESFLTFANL